MTEKILAALAEQSVVVAGTAAAAQDLPRLAASMRSTLDQRTEFEKGLSR